MSGPSIDVIEQGSEHELVIRDMGDTAADLFEANDLQGGGYTYLAILDAIIRTSFDVVERDDDSPEPVIVVRHAGAPVKLVLGAEGDNAFARAKSRLVIDALAALATKAATDGKLLTSLIEEADEALLE